MKEFKYLLHNNEMAMKKPLIFCANGDGNKVSPPSWVLCKRCKEEIKKNLEEMSSQLSEKRVMGKKYKEGGKIWNLNSI